jgi:sugar lactone lactonase YvrE
VTEPRTLMTGLAFGESPRWHEGRLWFSNWGAQEVVAVAPDGASEVVLRVPTTLPFCIDWLPDGRLLVVSGPEALLLRQVADGSLVTHADLNGLSDRAWNEIVVDGRGNAYVNGAGSDPMSGEPFAPGSVSLVTPDGSVRRVADDIAFPNGMAVTPDNATLIVADSYRHSLLAFDIADDGALSGRRDWAVLGEGTPDGICIDAEGAVWYADVPNRSCVRVTEGGSVEQIVELDRGGFACALGGPEGTTLFIVVAEWQGMSATELVTPGSGQVLTTQVGVPGAGWP